jgi:hypothetical protein
MKAFIAIPTYDSKIHLVTSKCLWQEQQIAAKHGVDLKVCYQPGISLVHSARNLLCWEFFKDEHKPDKLIFIDADTGWMPGTVTMLALSKRDVVAAGVRKRREPEEYAIKWLEEPSEQEADGCIEVAGIGMALTAITRSCLETYREKTPELAYEAHLPDGLGNVNLHGFFSSPVSEGTLWGEDIFFCEQWRKLGGKVYVDPRFPTTHADGTRYFEGILGKWMNEQVQS